LYTTDRKATRFCTGCRHSQLFKVTIERNPWEVAAPHEKARTADVMTCLRLISLVDGEPMRVPCASMREHGSACGPSGGLYEPLKPAPVKDEPLTTDEKAAALDNRFHGHPNTAESMAKGEFRITLDPNIIFGEFFRKTLLPDEKIELPKTDAPASQETKDQNEKDAT
jgi:hypothetical protein